MSLSNQAQRRGRAFRNPELGLSGSQYLGMVYKREGVWKSLLCAPRFLSLKELVVSLVISLDLCFRHSMPEYIVPSRHPLKIPGEIEREIQAERLSVTPFKKNNINLNN